MKTKSAMKHSKFKNFESAIEYKQERKEIKKYSQALRAMKKGKKDYWQSLEA